MRKWLASFGESDGCAWRRPLPIAEGSKTHLSRGETLQRRRWCISTRLTKSWDVGEAIRATTADTEDHIREREEDEAIVHRALNLLGSRRNDAYEAALAELREGTQEWWAEFLARKPDELDEGEKAATADVEGLRRFLEEEVLPWLESRKKEFANRPLIREQAFGKSLDPDKLERLGRYEVISTASSNGCSPCCCASRTCGRRRSRADPFRKINDNTHSQSARTL